VLPKAPHDKGYLRILNNADLTIEYLQVEVIANHRAMVELHQTMQMPSKPIIDLLEELEYLKGSLLGLVMVRNGG
jgi:hypothetical protein